MFKSNLFKIKSICKRAGMNKTSYKYSFYDEIFARDIKISLKSLRKYVRATATLF